jgi:Protein of unknown function (DUF2478)
MPASLPETSPEPALPHVAAIVDDRGTVMDAFLAGIVRQLQAEGHALRGCLMQRPDAAGCATMHLVDVHTGESYLVSQPMGSGSTACRADPQGFARASRIFQNALAEPPDLVVSNRFGDLEARGEGFSAELLALLAQGLPLLTTVAERNVPAWQAFTGGAVLLPPDEAAVLAWARGAIGG